MNQEQRLIVITGFMGAGKTAAASVLARRLACAMVDLDRFIEESEGRTIGEIIDEDGEQSFREIESRALARALKTNQARVVALGGGAWAFDNNRALINERNAFTVWLDAPFELCWKRIEDENKSRPLARDLTSARRLYDERRAFYSQAMLRVEVTEDKSPEQVAAEIADALPRFGA